MAPESSRFAEDQDAIKNGTASGVWESFWNDKGNHDWWKRPAPEILEFIAAQSLQERPNVFDLGCGLGRHAIAFAQSGFSVTAIDSSESAIVHLRAWAGSLSLPIQTKVCDVFDRSLQSDSFDIALSYNVIYHGYREQFAAAINRVRVLLREGGLFYFTCPTRQDGKYGFGKEVAPHTFLCDKSITPNDIHYFSDEADLDELLQGFHVIERQRMEGYWNNAGEEQFYSNWNVLAEKTLASK